MSKTVQSLCRAGGVALDKPHLLFCELAIADTHPDGATANEAVFPASTGNSDDGLGNRNPKGAATLAVKQTKKQDAHILLF